MATLGDLIIRVGCDPGGFVSAMADVGKSLDSTADKIEDRFEALGDVGRRFGMVGLEWTTAITLPLEEMGRRALETAAQFEQTQIAFTTFLGSSAAAKETLAGLYQFAAQTPFEVPGVLQAGRTLLAMGFSAKDIKPILTTLGDAASGLGVGQAGLERFVFHLGQIRALGHIDGMILREMGQNGVAAAQMIADYMGKSVPEITKMVTAKDPSLDSTTVINALLEGMNNQFGGAMKDQMQSLSGQWSNFKDQITLTSVAIGNTLLPIGKELLGWASEVLGKIKDLAAWFSQLPEPVQNGYIALAAFVGILGPLMTGIGGALMLIGPLAAAIGVGIGVFFGWAAAVGAVVVALVELGTWMANHWDGIKAAFQEFRFGTVSGMGTAFKDADSKAQASKTEDTSIDEARSTMHLGSHAYKIAPEDEAWATKHKAQVDQYTAALATLREEHKKGKVSADEVAEAEKKYQALLAAKPPKHATEKEGKTKLDRNALDGLSGEHAHEEAMLSSQRAQIEHDYAMSKPGSADLVGISPEAQAQQEIASAEKRKVALDKLASDELKSTLATIDKKLKLYRGDQNGHQALIEAKTKAEDKYGQEVRKTTFDVETIKKQANERILQDDINSFNKDLAAMAEANTRMQEAQKKHARDLATIAEETRKAQQQHAEAIISAEDKMAQFRLETGEITKTAYLKIKQDEVDRLYAMELQELEDAQKALNAEKAMALAAISPDRPDLIQGVNDEYQKRQVSLDGKKQQTTDRHDAKTEDIGLEKKKITNDRLDKGLAPFQSSFSSAIANLIKGTQTFRQAWSSMVTGMLGEWTNMLAKSIAAWTTHKIKELAVHLITERGKVAATTLSETQQTAVQNGNLLVRMARWLAHKIRELFVHTSTEAAKTAALLASETARLGIITSTNVAIAASDAAVAGAAALAYWSAVNPVIAPAMAMATYGEGMAFAGMAAFEQGGLVPGTGVAMLHGGEMVLPAPLSKGLQGLIESGAFQIPSAANYASMANGGGLTATQAHMVRDSAPSGGAPTHNHNWGGITVHNSAKDPITEDKIFNLMQGAMRKRNLQMA